MATVDVSQYCRIHFDPNELPEGWQVNEYPAFCRAKRAAWKTIERGVDPFLEDCIADMIARSQDIHKTAVQVYRGEKFRRFVHRAVYRQFNRGLFLILKGWHSRIEGGAPNRSRVNEQYFKEYVDRCMRKLGIVDKRTRASRRAEAWVWARATAFTVVNECPPLVR